jgi:hypothetical protein
MGPFVSNALALRKRGGDAFDPSMDLSYDPETETNSSDALRPTLSRPSEMALSATGGNNGPGIAPTDPEHTYMKDLQDVSGRLSAAISAPRPGVARQVLGALLSRRNPSIGGLVSGETQRQRTIEPLQQQYGMLANIITQNRAQQIADQQNRLRQAQIDRLTSGAATQDVTAGDQTLKVPTSQIGQVAGKLIGGESAENVANTRANSNETVADTRATSAGNTANTRATSAQDVANTRATSAQNVASIRAKAAASKATGEIKKATADEQRRADLANNLSENLDQLEEIVTRRPELFGPVSGRLTGAKQWAGTNDPDVAALKTIAEQTGMAMVGTHAMRNAQHVEAAANSITGANKNTPAALLGPQGSIAKARQSLKTFLGAQPVVGGAAGAQQPPSGAIELERGPDGKLRQRKQ